jgi:leucyl aminopeptidase
MTTVVPHPQLASPRAPFQLDAAARVPAGADVVGVGVPEGARSVRVPGGGTVDAAYLALAGFEGKKGQTAVLPGDGTRVVVAVGLGPAAKADAESLRTAAAALVRAAGRGRAGWAAFVPGAPPAGLDPDRAAQAVVEGAVLASYRYTTFKSLAGANGTRPSGGSRARPGPASPRPGARADARTLARLTVVGPHPAEMEPGIERGAAVAGAVALARDLINEPAGSLTPSRFAAIAQALASDTGLTVQVYDAAAIEAERLGGLAGVARGSDEEARLVRLEYRPKRRPNAPTVALVGKGITFDSGGLSLKTADGMMTMKTDMSGAAAVLATMSVLGQVGAPVRVIGYMPLTENMPGGRAIKPGDVLRARNGKTIEVLNTDAEGRLVLADGLSLAVEDGPAAIVDLATLTGAVVTALGRRIAGVMGNDDALYDQLEAAGARAGERLWRLPLPPDYRKDIDSEVADMKNIGGGGSAGSIVAGIFLQEFVGDVPWAHLDIAGTARADGDDGYVTRGATGFGVRTLVELLRTFKPTRSASPA